MTVVVTAPTQRVNDALLALLRQHLAPYPGGDHSVPAGATFPYWNLTAVPGGGVEGPSLGDAEELTTLVYQFDAVGQERVQAQAMQDLGVTVLLGRDGGTLLYPLGPIEGWRECGRLRDGVPEGIEREGNPPNAVYTGPVRVAVTITPDDRS